MQTDHLADAVKLAPPVAITATSLAGIRWDTASYVLACIYTALMIAHFLWTKIIRRWRHSEGSRHGR